MQESELINKLLEGKKKAFNAFYIFYQPRLLKFVMQKIADRKDAEEIVHDVLLDALDSLPFFRKESKLFSWICSIARHNIADFYRRKKIKKMVFSRFPFLKNLVTEALSPEFALEKKELQDRFYRTLKELPEGFGQILRLKYIDRLTVQEIADRFNTSYKAAESKLFRARIAFQKGFVQNNRDSQENRPPFDFTHLS